MASSPTSQSEGHQGAQISRTYADERVTNEFLYAVFDCPQSKGCFRRPRPGILTFRAPVISEALTHSFRYDKWEMAVCRAWRVVLWQVTEEKRRQHSSVRTIIFIELAIVVSPDGQVERCAVLMSKVRRDRRADTRTGELCRQETISPREADRIGKNRSRNCEPWTQPGPRHRFLGFLSL